MQTELEQLRKLPVAEKLRIVEQLWDDIGESEEQLLVRDWHRVEARRRESEIEAKPDITLTREELWKPVEETDG
jgi:putative addiction module component (TIGR02574 family)